MTGGGDGAALCRCTDFAAGAVSRDCWTCGSFSEIGGSLEKAALWHPDVVFGSALAANRLGRAAQCGARSTLCTLKCLFCGRRMDLEVLIS